MIPGLAQVPVHHLYRAMEFLLDAAEEVQREVFFATSDLLNLVVDLLYFDTTSTYVEVEEGAEAPESPGYRKRGYSRDHRPDLPQVVIGLAVTREGIPIRCWCWPGNTHDATVIEGVKRDLVGWKLGRVITVVDAGFTSEATPRTLQRTGGHYIAGERLRSGKPAVEAAIRRPGRYQPVGDNLEMKEIIVGTGPSRLRSILVRNPQEAERDRKQREALSHACARSWPPSRTVPARPTPERAARSWPTPPIGSTSARTSTAGCRSTRTRCGPRRGSTARTWCAPRMMASPPKISPWATGSSSRSKTPSARSNTPWICGPSTTGWRSGSARTCCCAGWRCCW